MRRTGASYTLGLAVLGLLVLPGSALGLPHPSRDWVQILPIKGHDAAVTGMVVDDEQRVVVAGTLDRASPASDIFAARLLPAGDLDRTFGSNGVAQVDLGGDEEATDLVAGPGQTLELAAGSGSDGLLVRLTDEGIPDPAFDDDGFLTFPFGEAGSHCCAALDLQPDGATVVVGTVMPGADGAEDIGAMRFGPDGSPDPAFGDDGLATFSFGIDAQFFRTYDRPSAVAVTADGSIVISADAIPTIHVAGGGPRGIFVRLDAGGDLAASGVAFPSPGYASDAASVPGGGAALAGGFLDPTPQGSFGEGSYALLGPDDSSAESVQVEVDDPGAQEVNTASAITSVRDRFLALAMTTDESPGPGNPDSDVIRALVDPETGEQSASLDDLGGEETLTEVQAQGRSIVWGGTWRRASRPAGDAPGRILLMHYSPRPRAPNTELRNRFETTNRRHPVFRFTSDDPASTFECRLDHFYWYACSSSQKLGNRYGLALGPHVFSVRATADGVAERWPAHDAFRVASR